ncbi:cobyrinate a,c-diamide synthase [Devosia sp.]|uniref:cobyrinate a,c-diamide synthase n=1 Tax=Devosia sp. TaxID=1871048 RepID=UPI0037BFF23A
MANGLVIAAPRSGSGKTTVTLGLLAALRARGIGVAPAKTGPDYIDRTILARAAGAEAINLDPWAMSPDRLRLLAATHAAGADLLLVEGVMGLFDGAASGAGSTADLATVLGLPVILVVDAERQSQSIAALVHGFATWRPQVRVAGVIVNRAASTRHEVMLRAALAEVDVPLLGVLPRRDTLVLPERHLGLVLPDEVAAFDAVVSRAAEAVSDFVDLNLLVALSSALAASPLPTSPTRGDVPAGGLGEDGATRSISTPPPKGEARRGVPPLGQHIAIARDDAFAFLYPHWLADWREAGASVSFFSPLADEAPDPRADAVFLPGGYPELHAGRIAGNQRFLDGLRQAAARDALIYGECGGFMVLGQTLTDKAGVTHAMAGLLPHDTRIDRPRRVLGYRRLVHAAPLPWPAALNGHEFHYSSARKTHGTPLFAAADALGTPLDPMGLVQGRVMGSYAHVIDIASA